MAAKKVRIVFFLEDVAHAQFVPPLVAKVARGMGISIQSIDIGQNYFRGHSVIGAFRQFLRDAQQQPPNADIVVLCVDGNCRGYEEKRRDYEGYVQKAAISTSIVYAISDPHIERWYLADPQAVRTALSDSLLVQLPDQKCDRDYYKNLLENTCEAANLEVFQGGAEYGADIVEHLQVEQAGKNAPTLQKFIAEIRLALQQAWQYHQQQP